MSGEGEGMKKEAISRHCWFGGRFESAQRGD